MKSNLLKLTLFSILILLLIIIYTLYREAVNTKAIIATGRVVINAGFVHNSVNENPPKHERRKVNSLKYILQWTSDSNVPFVYMGKGREGFVTRNCPHTNCFVTSNKAYLGDYTKFDVVAFAGPELSKGIIYGINKPERRSPHQKYVFASIEAADNYPICSNEYDGFFNWTWTYKLDSVVHWGYIVIRDLENNIIGPNKSMNWLKPDEMRPVSDEFKNRLKTKTKAAAWFVSNCISKSNREKVARELQLELSKYICDGTTCEVDVYGSCGVLMCSRDHENECDKNIERAYYFYLAFENAFSEDYVTEKLLRALKNNAVPIVYGGANYTR